MKLIILFIFSLLCFFDIFADSETEESIKCFRMFRIFESKFKIPKNILHSIALKESGRRHSKYNLLIPWPWAVNLEGKSYYFSSKKKAILFVKEQVTLGKVNIDVGCMQINLKHHSKAFLSLNNVFDPEWNVEYGAKFLRSKYDKLGNWYNAIAHYHSKNEKGLEYMDAVIKIADRIHLNNKFWHQRKGEGGIEFKIASSYKFNKQKKRYRSNMMVLIPKIN